MEIDIAYIAVVIGVILFSMTLHEVMHGFVAYLLGDDTAKIEGRLTLNPIHHIDPIMTIVLPVILALIGAPIFGGAKPVPFNPARLKYDEWGAALVAMAGPLTNLLIAFVTFGVWVLLGTPALSSTLGLVIYTTVIVNLGFFIFNSLPIPPLDGSRVLYVLAPDLIRKGMEALETYGGIFFIIVIVMLSSGAIGSLMSDGINFFLEIFQAIFIIG